MPLNDATGQSRKLRVMAASLDSSYTSAAVLASKSDFAALY
jgi:hypothetical protein